MAESSNSENDETFLKCTTSGPAPHPGFSPEAAVNVPLKAAATSCALFY